MHLRNEPPIYVDMNSIYTDTYFKKSLIVKDALIYTHVKIYI